MIPSHYAGDPGGAARGMESICIKLRFKHTPAACRHLPKRTFDEMSKSCRSTRPQHLPLFWLCRHCRCRPPSSPARRPRGLEVVPSGDPVDVHYLPCRCAFKRVTAHHPEQVMQGEQRSESLGAFAWSRLDDCAKIPAKKRPGTVLLCIIFMSMPLRATPPAWVKIKSNLVYSWGVGG